MTMSISSAPAATASAVSSSLIERDARPLGNAVATAATAMPPPSGSPCDAPSACTACPTMSPYTQTAATRGQLGSPESGVTAFATRDRTLPGVSAPSSVVRSMRPMIRSSAHAFEVVLIERVPSPAARCWRPTASTPGMPCR